MSRKYKFHEKEGAYFISFVPVFRIDILTRIEYFDIVMKSPLVTGASVKETYLPNDTDDDYRIEI
ncbi:hypothetical protein [Chryseobacterium sp.]|uniref:hypothetical protein n=1 Tax=Chryseobacterium sp. TaxID=1871047 RepID=UPI0025C514F5|nr:hypothetical protein [Chryseobacterium sp.]MBV8326503.1 hypothetical protein [Chryseobacterium sp.]